MLNSKRCTKKEFVVIFYDIAPEDTGKRLKPYGSVAQRFPFTAPLWLRKKMDSHILAHVNVECLDNRHPKLEIYA
jgi:hypothetical protein